MTIPGNINSYRVTTIGTNAFYEQTSLTGVMIPDSVTNIGEGPFAYCSGLTNINVAEANPSYVSAGGVSFNITMTRLIQYPAGLLAGSYAIPNSVTSIGDSAFDGCSGLHQAYFEGNAPSVDGGAGSAYSSVFSGESGTAYYVPGTTGWGTYFGGWPTAGWYQPRPQILGAGYGLGAGSQGFQFTISWATNTAVVVEASTNLQNWTPLSTNTLIAGTNVFWDSDWTHYPQRFHRVGVEQ